MNKIYTKKKTQFGGSNNDKISNNEIKQVIEKISECTKSNDNNIYNLNDQLEILKSRIFEINSILSTYENNYNKNINEIYNKLLKLDKFIETDPKLLSKKQQIKELLVEFKKTQNFKIFNNTYF